MSKCETCEGRGWLEYGGMAMEDDLVEKEPCFDCDGTGMVTDMVATDSKPSTGHSEPPQEDPTTKLDTDRVSDERLLKSIGGFTDEQMAIIKSWYDELIISERIEELEFWISVFERADKEATQRHKKYKLTTQANSRVIINGFRQRIDQLSKSKRSE